jgi:nitrate/nitrite-specific signal transduction histidine kinase
MRERARNAGGTLDIAAAPGGGTQVTVSLPLHDGRGPARRLGVAVAARS